MTPIRRFRSSVLLVLLLHGFVPLGLSAQFLPPPPPIAPHPDSSGAVVVTQAASIFVASMLLDGTMRAGVAAASPDDRHPLSRVGNVLGRGPTLTLAVAGVYGGSRLAGLDDVSTTSGRTLAALVVAGAANGLVKFSVGRARPVVDGGGMQFRPFSLEDRWQSFPSGHAVTAFALATAIAEQADREWVTYASYGTATLVGWSRVHEDRHWTSDVVAGAILGTVAARLTVRHLEARSPRAAPGARPPHHARTRGPLTLLPLPGGVAVNLRTP